MYGDYEKIGKQTYLRLVAGEGEVRDDFACRMISEVEIPGLIRLYYVPSGGCDIYKYNITNYTRLDDFMEGYVSNEEMIMIMRSVINTVRNVGGYALSADNIIMSKYSIYLNKNTMDVRMIYVPVRSNVSDAFAGLKNMFIDMVDNVPFKEERFASLSEKLNGDMIQSLDELECEINGFQASRMVNKDTEAVVQNNSDVSDKKGFRRKNKKMGYILKKCRKNTETKWNCKNTSKKIGNGMVSINVPLF